MMESIAAILKLVFAIFSTILERNKARKKIKEGALQEIKDGIKNRDASLVTSGFATIRRVR